MSSILVRPGEVTVPGMCVACGTPATMPANEAERKAASLEATGSVTSAGMVFSDKVWLPLCPECAAARQRAADRESAKGYEGRWATITAGLACAVLAAGWFAGVQVAPESTLTTVAFWLAIAVLITAVALSKNLRARYQRLNPPSEEDTLRLALIGQAVKIDPQVSGTEIAAVLVTFANEDFYQAFAALNPAVAWTGWRST